MAQNSPRLLDQLREKIRLKHYSIQLYRLGAPLHPVPRAAPSARSWCGEVEALLTHLAVVGRVAAPTPNQAKSALLFLYPEVLGLELPWLDNVEQAKVPRQPPVVLTVAEVGAVLDHTDGTPALTLRVHLRHGHSDTGHSRLVLAHRLPSRFAPHRLSLLDSCFSRSLP